MAFNLGSIFASVGLNVAPLKAGIAKSQAMMGSLDKSMAASSARVGSTMVAGFKKFAKVGVVALAAVGVAAVSMAASFDKSMREVNSLIRLSEAEFKKFKTSVLDMSTTVEHSANELAQGMYWVVSAMPDASDAEGLKVLEASSRLATAGVAEMADAADLMTTALNAWGLSVEDTTHVSDVLLKIVERGKTTLPELAANFSKAATSAAMMGVPIEDLGAVLATLTRIGIPADRALMGLNRTLLGMAKPSEAAAEWIKSIGFESGSAMFETIGFEGVLQKLHAAFGNNVEAMAELFPNIRELMVLLPATGKNFSDIVKDMESFDDAAGTTDKMFEQMAETIQYKWAIAVDNIKKVMIELGEKIMPTVEKGIAALTRIAKGENEAFNEFADALKRAGTALYNMGQFIFETKPLLYGLAAAFAAVKIAAFLAPLAGATTGLGAISAVAGALGISLGTIAAPIAAAAAVVGLFAYETWQADKKADKAWKTIRELDEAHGELGKTLQPLVTRYQELNAKVAEGVAPVEELAAADAELKTIRAEIASQFPSLIDGHDEEGIAILKQDEALNHYIDSLLRYSDVMKVTTTGETAEFEILLGDKAALEAQVNAIDAAMTKVSQALMDVEGPGFDAGLVISDLSDNFELGVKSIEGWQDHFEAIGETEAADKLNEIGLALGIIEGMGKGKNINELRAQLEEIGNAASQMAAKLNEAAYQAGLAGEELSSNIVEGLRSASPEFRQAAVDNLAKYLQGQLEMRGIATVEAGAMAQEMANAFVSGGEWDSKGNEAAQEVMDGLITRIGDGRGAIADAAAKAASGFGPGFLSGLPSAESLVAGLLDGIRNAIANANIPGPVIDAPTEAEPGVPGPGGIPGDAGIAAMTGDVDNLTDAFQRLVETGLVGWSEAIAAVPFGEAEQGLINLLRQTGMAEDEMWRQLQVWRETRAAYDAAEAPLDELSSSIAKHENTIDTLTEKQGKINDAMAKWRERLSDANEAISIQQELLSRLSRIKLKGETAADQKSFDLQQKSSKLQLAILKAEEEQKYGRAAMLTLEKERVDKEKELHDLQADITYAPQRREIEQLLDPLHEQEMKQWQIVAAIKAAQKEIKAQEAIQDKMNVKIEMEEEKLKAVTEQINLERVAVIRLKEEFDNAKVHVDSFKAKIDDLHNNFIAQFQEMQRAAEEAARAAIAAAKEAEKVGGFAWGGTVAGAGGMRMSGARTPNVTSNYGVTVNVPLYIDGREVAYATTRVTGSNASRYARSGGKY